VPSWDSPCGRTHMRPSHFLRNSPVGCWPILQSESIQISQGLPIGVEKQIFSVWQEAGMAKSEESVGASRFILPLLTCQSILHSLWVSASSPEMPILSECQARGIRKLRSCAPNWSESLNSLIMSEWRLCCASSCTLMMMRLLPLCRSPAMLVFCGVAIRRLPICDPCQCRHGVWMWCLLIGTHYA
jgi:hypothetical protein